MRYFRAISGLGLVTILTGCALGPSPTAPLRHGVGAGAEAARCLAFYQRLDRTADRFGTARQRPQPVNGFPYLRADRFLASYRDDALNMAQRRVWLTRLAALDRQAREAELASLPPGQLAALRQDLTLADRDQAPAALDAMLQAELTRCAGLLLRLDLQHPERFARLRQAVTVDSEYRTLKQVLGAYPLSAIPVSLGVRRYQNQTRATFARPLAELPRLGVLRRYLPPADERSAAAMAPVPVAEIDALGVPDPDSQRLAWLFARHAPVWEIDVAGDYDRPGQPLWLANGLPSVNPNRPTVYRYISHSRWYGKVLLQLNYLIWFAERPAAGRFDILAGPLDGILWRVTLRPDGTGEPLLYDTIHPCGCYHMFFPTGAVALKTQAQRLAEPPLLPQPPLPVPANGQRIVIRIASGSHYVQRVYLDMAEPAGQLISIYRWQDYQTLYAVPVAGGGLRRSLFASNGLTPGSERFERWLLWPTGVPSPGAMRERGRHAVAFVGRRHFDDARLLERLFINMRAAGKLGS